MEIFFRVTGVGLTHTEKLLIIKLRVARETGDLGAETGENCNIRPNATQRRSVEKVPINDWQGSVTLILLAFHRLDLAS